MIGKRDVTFGILTLAVLCALLMMAAQPAQAQYTGNVLYSLASESPKITSISKISSLQSQTIVITGSGFGTQQPYTGDSNYLEFADITKGWGAGYNIDAVTLIVNSWEDSQIVLGGFSGSWGSSNWTLDIGDKVEVLVWNPQSGNGPASKYGRVTADAQSPKITSISRISPFQYQTIVITGGGFGTQQPYTGDSHHIWFADTTKGWGAGYNIDAVTLIVNSWEDSQIVLGGFSGSWGSNNWTLDIGDKVNVDVWNPQSGDGPAIRYSKVTLAATTSTLTSSPNPSANGQAVTFTAVVDSNGGTPPDGETVSFMEGTTVLGTGTLSGGSATFTTSTLNVGTTLVKALYAGDSDFDGSKSKPVKQVVKK